MSHADFEWGGAGLADGGKPEIRDYDAYSTRARGITLRGRTRLNACHGFNGNSRLGGVYLKQNDLFLVTGLLTLSVKRIEAADRRPAIENDHRGNADTSSGEMG